MRRNPQVVALTAILAAGLTGMSAQASPLRTIRPGAGAKGLPPAWGPGRAALSGEGEAELPAIAAPGSLDFDVPLTLPVGMPSLPVAGSPGGRILDEGPRAWPSFDDGATAGEHIRLPEPTSLLLLVAGVLGLAARRRLRRRHEEPVTPASA